MSGFDVELVPAWRRGRRRLFRTLATSLDRRQLGSRSFSIISNDCWGAQVYQALKLPYQTPFVGLMIHGPCFMTLVRDPRRTIEQDLSFTGETRYAETTQWRTANGLNYPIGLLGTKVELHFMHETSPDAAKEKWDRRRTRIDWDNIFITLTGDKDGVTTAHLREFDNLSYDYKIAFTRRPYPNIQCVLPISRYEADGAAMYWLAQPEFDTVRWLNGDDGRVSRVRRGLRRYRAY